MSSMNFFKRHILKLELVIVIILASIIFLTLFSIFFAIIDNESFLGNAWMYLNAFPFVLYFTKIGIWGVMGFYIFLMVFPIIGIVLRREEKKYVLLHFLVIFAILGYYFLSEGVSALLGN